VNAVPRRGVIRTPDGTPGSDLAALAALHPIGARWVRSKRVAEAIPLPSTGADFVTGEILHVDGGQAAGH